MMNDRSVQNIADIARICNVSKSTVSRALSDSPLISMETKERIRAVAKENHFQVNIPARRLSMQRSHTIAFAVHGSPVDQCFSITDLFSLEILGAVSSTLATYHYDLLIANVNPRDATWPHQYLDTGRVDGFILLTSSYNRASIKTMVGMKAPFIVWGIPMPGFSYSTVINDNFSGGKQAAGHLLRTGKRRIAFIGGPADELETQRRYDGYAAALQENGQTVDPALVSYGEWSDESGAEQMQRLLAAVPDLDGVFANSDLMAIGAINVLHDQGRPVPQDVAVVGYDGLSLAKFSSPPLTTISQNIPLVGKMLAQNLIQNIETGVVTNVTVPADLVIRKSA
jgi:DNA-binding LacI/PurR family transcriptional regulator